MKALDKLLLAGVAAATITLSTAVQPASAQIAGIGPGGTTTVLFKGYDSSILLVEVDKNLNPTLLQPVPYGPYEGWTPIALAVAANAYTYVLWQDTGGLVSLWKLDPSLNFVKDNGPGFGPFPGWIAEGLAADTDGSSYLRLIWRNTNGAVSIWCVDPNLNPCGSNVLGPYVGVAPER